MEVRRIDIRRRREPPACAPEIKLAEQTHEYCGRDDDDHARQIVGSGCLTTQQVPDFRQIVDKRRVEEEQRLPTAISKIRRPARQEHAVVDILVELY